MEPIFFATPPEWRRWLAKNHAEAVEVWVGFYKVASGKPSITWPQAVDEALCFGWIDGLRRGIDDISYQIRFTPRKRSSTWSAINIKRAAELSQQGLMQTAGLAAFAARKEHNSKIYSYEQAEQKLPEIYENKLKANQKAWEYWQKQPPGYQKTASWWLTSAKREETRLRRLETLIADCKAGRRIGPLTWRKNRSPL